VKIAFNIAQKENNIVVLFRTLKVQSFILTEAKYTVRVGKHTAARHLAPTLVGGRGAAP